MEKNMSNFGKKFDNACKETFERLTNPKFELDLDIGRISDPSNGFWMDLGYDMKDNIHQWNVQDGEWCKTHRG